MRFWKPRAKRLAALVCALAMTVSLLPTAVFADTGETVSVASSTVTEEEKTKETPAPDATEEEQNTSSVPGEQPKEQPSPEPSESPAPEGTPTPSASPEVTAEPTESPAPSAAPTESPAPAGTPTPTPSASPEGTPEPSESPEPAPNEVQTFAANAPRANDMIYNDAENGITVQLGSKPASDPQTVTFVVMVEAKEVARQQLTNVPKTAARLEVSADGWHYDAWGENATVTSVVDDYLMTFDNSDEHTVYINFAKPKQYDTIEITDEETDTDYGSFTWTKGNATNCASVRTVIIKVNGDEVYRERINTPSDLVTGGTSNQFGFNANLEKFNSDVKIDPLTLVRGSDVTFELTTRCPCGLPSCQCPGGTECEKKGCVEGNCPCGDCMPPEGTDVISTPYGVITYQPTGDDDISRRQLEVQIYLNGEKVHTENLQVRNYTSLTVKPAENAGIYFHPQAAGLNSFDIETELPASSWEPGLGHLTINGTSPDYNNVLKVYFWSFDEYTMLNVDRRSDAKQYVNGYTISFMAYDPGIREERLFTYPATSFSAAQKQAIPYGKPVILTADCETGYEVSQWGIDYVASDATLTGAEGERTGADPIQAAFGNTATLTVVDLAAADDVLVRIDDVRPVTPPTKEELESPTEIFVDGAVTVDCVSNESHTNQKYVLLPGTYKVSKLQGDSVSGYYVTVTITNEQEYVDRFNKSWDGHTLGDDSNLEITLRWVVENQKSVWKPDSTATIKVTCDDGGDEPVDPDLKPGEPIKIQVYLDGKDVTADYADYLHIEAGEGTTGEAAYDAANGLTFQYQYETYNCADITYKIKDGLPCVEHAVAATLVYGENGSEGIEHPDTNMTVLDNVQGDSTVTIYLATPYGVDYYVDGDWYSADDNVYAKVDPACEHNMSNVPGAGSGAEQTVGENGMQKGYEVCYKTGLLTEITLASTEGLDAWYPQWDEKTEEVKGKQLTSATIALATILANKSAYTIDDSGSMANIQFFGVTAPENAKVEVEKTSEVKRDGQTITVNKDNPLQVGDEITYTITVKNTGNVTLTGLTITDTFNGQNEPVDEKGLTWTGEAGNWTGSVTLAVAAVNNTYTYRYTYTVAEEDLGKTLTNTATVTGGGLTDDDPDNTDDEKLPVEEKDPAAEITKKLAKIVRNGEEVNNYASDAPLKVGDVITYEITVTNTGNVTLNNLTVTDTFNGAQKPGEHWQPAEDGGWTADFIIKTLEPGKTYSETYAYTVVQADADKMLTNSAVVTGDDLDDPDNPPPEDEDEHKVEDDGKITLQPADMTIYMGGKDGYEAVMNGNVSTSSNSLPEPGFYITLPDEVNRALGGNGHAADLSGKITVTAATKDGAERTWTLQKYGDSTSTALIDGQEHFVYKIVPGENQPAIRVAFTDNAGNTVTSDAFTLADNLSNEYKMNLYTGDVDVASISLKIQADDGKTFYCGYDADKSDPGTLTVRYTNAERAATTPAKTDLAAAVEENPDQFHVGVAEGQKFYINEQDAGAAGVDVLAADVSLLADDLTGNGAGYSETDLLQAAVLQANFASGYTGVFGKYFDLVDAQNGNAWLTPADGSTVTVFWPYPADTDKNTNFKLYHFDGLDREGTAAAGASAIDGATPTEVQIEKGEHGITFTTSSFSPFVLTYELPKQSQPGDEDKPSGDGDNNNNNSNNNTSNTNNQNNNAASASASASATVTAPAAAAVIPQTGDDMPVGLLAGLAIVAAGGLAALWALRKRRGDR